MISDYVTRKEAALMLGLTVEGVRKLEGRDLTATKDARGRVMFSRSEVEALHAARGARIPVATKAEREREREDETTTRAEASKLRAERRVALEEARSEARRWQDTEAKLQREDDARRARERELQATSDAWEESTVDKAGAASILGIPPHEVTSLVTRGHLPTSSLPHGLSTADQMTARVHVRLPNMPRFSRDEVYRVREALREAEEAPPPPAPKSEFPLPSVFVGLLGLATAAAIARSKAGA